MHSARVPGPAPMAIGRRDFGVTPAMPWPALDILEPPPSTALLSAEDAKAQLREIVEGFFFRRRNEQGMPPGRHLLVRSPPGLGKTRQAMEWATRYQSEQGAKSSISQ